MRTRLSPLVLAALIAVYGVADVALHAHRGVRVTSNSYTTNFAGTENPLSQGGRWINAGLSGLDWKDIRISGGLAYGTQDGLQGNGVYNDSVAVLTGTWAADQTLTATVKATNQQCAGNDYSEVELWGRVTIAPHSVKGYEVNYRNCNTGGQYIGIVKWIGPFGGPGVQYNQLGSNCTSFPGLSDGDTIKITVAGTSTVTITAYVNGTQYCQQTDSSSPYTTGNPGIGHWVHWASGALGSASDYGLTSLTVTAQ